MATNLSSPFAQIRSPVLEVVLLRLRHCGNAGRDRARGAVTPFRRFHSPEKTELGLVRGLWVRCHRSAPGDGCLPEGAVRLLAWLAGITSFVFFCFGVVTKSSSSASNSGGAEMPAVSTPVSVHWAYPGRWVSFLSNTPGRRELARCAIITALYSSGTVSSGYHTILKRVECGQMPQRKKSLQLHLKAILSRTGCNR